MLRHFKNEISHLVALGFSPFVNQAEELKELAEKWKSGAGVSRFQKQWRATELWTKISERVHWALDEDQARRARREDQALDGRTEIVDSMDEKAMGEDSRSWKMALGWRLLGVLEEGS